MSIGNFPYMLNENQTCEAYYDWEKSCYCSTNTNIRDFIRVLCYVTLAGLIKGLGLMAMQTKNKTIPDLILGKTPEPIVQEGFSFSRFYNLIKMNQIVLLGLILWVLSHGIEIFSRDPSVPIMIPLIFNGGTFIITVILSEVLRKKSSYIRFASIVGCFLGDIQILSNAIMPDKHANEELFDRISHVVFWVYIIILFLSAFITTTVQYLWKLDNNCDRKSPDDLLSPLDWKKLFIFITNICIIACYSNIVLVLTSVLKIAFTQLIDGSDAKQVHIIIKWLLLIIPLAILALIWLIKKLCQSLSESPSLFTIVAIEEGATVIFRAITYCVVYQRLPPTISNKISTISGFCIITVSLFFLFQRDAHDGILKNISVREQEVADRKTPEPEDNPEE